MLVIVETLKIVENTLFLGNGNAVCYEYDILLQE